MDTEPTRRKIDDIPVETNMDLMLERAIASLVERGKMTPEDAATKRADLWQSRDAARDRADRAEVRRAANARIDGAD